jgi:hypothetical protein
MSSVRLQATSMQNAPKQVLENRSSGRRLLSEEESTVGSLQKFVPYPVPATLDPESTYTGGGYLRSTECASPEHNLIGHEWRHST